MTGRELTNDDNINIEIFAADENFENEISVATTRVVDGKFKFEIEEATAGNKYYIIKEQATGLQGVKDDTAVYKVTVEVTKGEGDALSYSIKSKLKNGSAAESIEFVNEYTPNCTTYIIKGEKALEGREIQNGEFEFILKDAEGKEVETVKVKDGKFEFTALTFETKGTYTYTVAEVQGSDETITYDDTVYTVTIAVSDDGQATLTPIATITVGEDAKEAVVFNNVYTRPTVPVPTPTPTPNPNPPMGDAANIFLWFAVAFVSGGLMLATGLMGKKKQAE